MPMFCGVGGQPDKNQNQLPSQEVFIWRRASPLTRATWRRASPLTRATCSPTKRARFHLAFTWRKPALLPGLARLAESPGLTTFIFPQNPEPDICIQVFILYPTHNKQSLWNEKLSKKCWSKQPLSCVRSFDLLALLGGPALLSAFIWKISSPPRQDLGSQ